MKFIIFLSLFYFAHSKIQVAVLCSQSGPFSIFGSTVQSTLEIWKSRSPYASQYAFTFFDTKSSPASAINATKQALGYAVIFGPESLLLNSVATTINNKIPLVVTMGGGRDLFIDLTTYQRRFTNVFGLLTPGYNYFQAFFPIMRRQNYKTAFILQAADTLQMDIGLGAKDSAEENGFDVQKYIIQSVDNAQTLVDRMVNVGADVIVLVYWTYCEPILQEMEARNYFPKAMGAFECGNQRKTFKNPERAKYLFTPTQWVPQLKGAEFTDDPHRSFGNLFAVGNPSNSGNTKPSNPSNSASTTTTSAQKFYQTYLNHTSHMNSVTAAQMAGWYLLDYANNCSTSQCFMDAFAKAQFYSFFGLISPGMDGMNSLRTMVLLQVDTDGNDNIIEPSVSSIKDPILPTPNWNERYYSPVGLTVDSYVFLFWSCVGAACCITLMVVMFNYRDVPEIKASSYKFQLFILIGISLGFFTPYTWTIDASSAQCTGRVILFCISFAFVIPLIIAKTWRIVTIFEAKLQLQRIPDGKLAIVTLFIQLPVWILMAAALADIRREYHVPDYSRLNTSYYDCSLSNQLLNSFLGFIGIYFAVILVLSWRVRLAYAMFNESKSIAFGSFMFIFFLLITLIYQLAGGQDRKVIFIVRTFGILVAYSALLLILFFNKVAAVFWSDKNGVEKISRHSTNATIISEAVTIRVKGSTYAPGS